jgi:hypothetical protein
MRKGKNVEEDRSIPIFLLIVGFGFLFYSGKYTIGSLTNPGVGFFPILIAAGLVGLSGAFLWQKHRSLGILRRSRVEGEDAGESIWGGKAYGVIATLIAFAALHAILGFWVSVLGAMAALLRIAGVPSWKRALLGGGITAVVSYLVFEYYLGAMFPEGFLR